MFAESNYIELCPTHQHSWEWPIAHAGGSDLSCHVGSSRHVFFHRVRGSSFTADDLSQIYLLLWKWGH